MFENALFALGLSLDYFYRLYHWSPGSVLTSDEVFGLKSTVILVNLISDHTICAFA